MTLIIHAVGDGKPQVMATVLPQNLEEGLRGSDGMKKEIASGNNSERTGRN